MPRARRSTSSTLQRSKRADNLAGLGIAVVAVLGKDELAVGRDVEHAVRALRQLGVNPQGLLDLGSQTGRPRQVVSGNAVGDDDLHRPSF